MYLIINSDQTLNAIVDDIEQTVIHSGCETIDLPDQTTQEHILGDVPFEEALWDTDLQKVVQDPEFVKGGEAWRRRKATERINEFYPLSKQMNLLRSGDKAAIKEMSVFIDKCRKWSNEESIAEDIIQRITP